MSVATRITAHELDATSDAIDEGQLQLELLTLLSLLTPLLVNTLKGRKWDAETDFDKDKNKSTFWNYDAACDHVKAFYREQHGELFGFTIINLAF